MDPEANVIEQHDLLKCPCDKAASARMAELRRALGEWTGFAPSRPAPTSSDVRKWRALGCLRMSKAL